MTTGEKICESRKKLNLTQQQFADTLGVTRQAVSRWESDAAFPETDTLIKMSELFGCSIDYLLKYDNANPDSAADTKENGEAAGVGGNQGETVKDRFDSLKWSYEYKSEKQILGMPLVHINIGLGRRAHGFFSVGLVSTGIISLGLVSAGVISIGVLCLGLISLGIIALGGLALGAVALGIIALGSVAVGIIALGGVAIGCLSLGGCSVGLFAAGGYANGRYVAVGDYAVGGIAFGDTYAAGNVLTVTKETFPEQKAEAWEKIDELPQYWKGFADLIKRFAESFMLSKKS